MTDVCSEINIKTEDLPRFVLFKSTGGYEMNYVKKHSVHDLATFIREARHSKLISLTEDLYNDAINGDELWLIDYFAPWCPRKFFLINKKLCYYFICFSLYEVNPSNSFNA